MMAPESARASGVTARSTSAEVPRAVVRPDSRLKRLLCTVAAAPPKPAGMRIEVSGPHALFRHTTLYGSRARVDRAGAARAEPLRGARTAQGLGPGDDGCAFRAATPSFHLGSPLRSRFRQPSSKSVFAKRPGARRQSTGNPRFGEHPSRYRMCRRPAWVFPRTFAIVRPHEPNARRWTSRGSSATGLQRYLAAKLRIELRKAGRLGSDSVRRRALCRRDPDGLPDWALWCALQPPDRRRGRQRISRLGRAAYR